MLEPLAEKNGAGTDWGETHSMALRTALLSVVLGSSIASAQMLTEQGPPQHRIVHKNTLALRVNPLGLIYDGRFAYRLRLYQSDSKVLRDNYLGIGIAPNASPAFVGIGPYLEFSPLTMFSVWAMVQAIQYFGSFNLLQGFAGAQSDFSDTAIRTNAANHVATGGYEVTVGANFQAKVSVVLLRSQARLIYGSMKLKDNERVYYSQLYDMAMPNQGWAFVNDLDLVYQSLDSKILAGARYTATVPLYDPARHLDPNDPIQTVDNAMHRVGPFLAYTFKVEDGARFNTPTVFLLVQWWLKHRFRTGLDTPAALPLFGVGFQMTGDFLPVK